MMGAAPASGNDPAAKTAPNTNAGPTSKRPNPHQNFPPPPVEIFDKKGNNSYKRGNLLGEGGFARCFEVWNNKTGHRMAAKVVPKASLKSQKQKQKLITEIKIHSQMNHPHIVKFHHVFEDDDNVYMILELCENKTCVDMIRKRRRLSEPEVRYYMKQVLEAVQYMHLHRVIHRDLKLGNFFLTEDMVLKIGDFGLAATIKHDGERKKTICGTPNYIAPEVLFDTQNGHSYEVDVWSVGVVLYTYLIGKPPFQTKDVKHIYKKIKDINYEFPSSVPLSDHARDIITSLLNKNPEHRPTISEVLEHPWFSCGIPKSIPVSALHTTPIFDKNSLIFPADEIKENGIEKEMRNMSLDVRDKHSAQPQLQQIPQQQHGDFRTRQTGRQYGALNRPGVAPAAEQAVKSHSPSKTQTEENVPLARHANPSETLVNKHHQAPSQSQPRSNLPEPTQRQPSSSKTTASSKSARKESPIKDDLRRVAAVVSTTSPRAPLAPTSASNVQSQNVTPKRSAALTSNGKSLMKAGASQFAATYSSPSISSPSRRPRNVLESMYQTLQSSFSAVESEGKSSPSLQVADLGNKPETPLVFISKWIDYSNKYGLGYQLTNGCIGVYFNDSTGIVTAADEYNFEYLYQEGEARMHRTHYTMDTYPPELRKKVILMTHFRQVMQKTLYKSPVHSFIDRERISDLDYLTKYLRTKHAVVFRLSNRIVQLNFLDHTKIILSSEAEVVTWVDKDRQFRTDYLVNFLREGNNDVVGRLKYAKNVLEQLILKKYKKESATPTKPGVSNVERAQVASSSSK